MITKLILFLRRTHLMAYLRVWLKLTAQQFESQVMNARFAAFILILGKMFRLVTTLFVVNIIVGKAKLIAGYDLNQAIFILILFNFSSTISQLFLRGVYMFRQKVVDGAFDFYLLNPLNELFYSLFSATDPLDILVSIPYFSLLLWAWSNAGYPLTLFNILMVFLVVIISFIMVLAWHIVVISIGVRYLEVDNTIMLYRDLEKMGSFPTEMYGRIGNFLLSYFAPFALLATVPARIVFGLFQPLGLLIFIVLAAVQFKFAILFWKKSLSHYSSASS